MIRGSLHFWQIAATAKPTRKISARDVNIKIPPPDAKKLMLFCENVITEVISFTSSLGFPRENFIPKPVYYIYRCL